LYTLGWRSNWEKRTQNEGGKGGKGPHSDQERSPLGEPGMKGMELRPRNKSGIRRGGKKRKEETAWAVLGRYSWHGDLNRNVWKGKTTSQVYAVKLPSEF